MKTVAFDGQVAFVTRFASVGTDRVRERLYAAWLAENANEREDIRQLALSSAYMLSRMMDIEFNLQAGPHDELFALFEFWQWVSSRVLDAARLRTNDPVLLRDAVERCMEDVGYNARAAWQRALSAHDAVLAPAPELSAPDNLPAEMRSDPVVKKKEPKNVSA